jgi:hypothetical protein
MALQIVGTDSGYGFGDCWIDSLATATTWVSRRRAMNFSNLKSLASSVTAIGIYSSL